MKTKDEQFKIELNELLKKFDAEMILDECGKGYNVDYRILVEFNWDPSRETEPTKEINLGSYIDGSE